MKDPSINRYVGLFVMFMGLYFVFRGIFSHSETGVSFSINPWALTLAGILIVGSFVWMMLTVRCPHCHYPLEFQLSAIDICPSCGKCTYKEYSADNKRQRDVNHLPPSNQI